MKPVFHTRLLIACSLIMSFCTSKQGSLLPPKAPVKPVTDNYFGVQVTDPYRYMEDLNDSTVRGWFKAQSDYARKVIDHITGRQSLIDKMIDFDKRKSDKAYMLTIAESNRYFYLKQTPKDETGKLFYRDGYTGSENLLFDPTTYGSDTTKKYTISSIAASDNGLNIAFEIAAQGSESTTLLIMDVPGKKLYPEKIDRCWFASVSWLPDGKSFLFNRLNSSDVHDLNREKNSKIFLHQAGKDPSADLEIFSAARDPELKILPEEIPAVIYDKDSKNIIAMLQTVDQRLKCFISPAADLLKSRIPWKILFNRTDSVANFSTTDKYLYIYSYRSAPNYKLLRTAVNKPDVAHAEVMIPENKVAKLTGYTVNNEGIYYTLSFNGVQEKFYRTGLQDKAFKEIDLPSPAGSATVYSRGYKFGEIWVVANGWTTDYKRLHYFPDKNEFKLEMISSVADYPEYKDLMVEELMIPSHDGVMVPLSLIYKKGLEKNGNNPVLLYGYGSYGISQTPFFSPSFLLWTYEGGILAIAHVRGGGELGDQWHMGGFKSTKPNTWKDFIACAEYLIQQKYTSPKKIAMNGGSAGGILIGRAMTERPDLFAAAIPQVGAMNTLRGENTPNGPVNAPEFGTVKDSAECMALLEMDSYQHIKDGEKYPATLITAGMNDPRVIAWQPGKFAARLYAANTSDKPVLFLVDYQAGHGIGNTKTKQFESLADVLSFALWQTGNTGFQEKE